MLHKPQEIIPSQKHLEWCHLASMFVTKLFTMVLISNQFSSHTLVTAEVNGEFQ